MEQNSTFTPFFSRLLVITVIIFIIVIIIFIYALIFSLHFQILLSSYTILACMWDSFYSFVLLSFWLMPVWLARKEKAGIQKALKFGLFYYYYFCLELEKIDFCFYVIFSATQTEGLVFSFHCLRIWNLIWGLWIITALKIEVDSCSTFYLCFLYFSLSLLPKGSYF